MKKKTPCRFLQMKRRIAVILALFCGIVCALTAVLEFSATKNSYEEIKSMEINDSEIGIKNAERSFVRQVEEIIRLDYETAEKYTAGDQKLEDAGGRAENIESTYYGVLERQDGVITGYYPRVVSYYSFKKTMDEFLEQNTLTGNIHFFAHNFSNSKNAIVLVHQVETGGADLLFVYQIEDTYYWSDYTDNSLRNGYFLYDIILDSLAPSRPSFVNMTEVVRELKKGKELGSLIFGNDTSDRLVSYVKCEKVDVYLFNSIPIASFQSFLVQDLKEKLPLYIVFLCAVSGVGWVFYRFICRPVIAISEALNREIQDETLFSDASESSAIYSPVVDIVNEMKRKILLIKENEYKERLLKEQAELIMLQSQINPHFMYNTLESIRAMATLEGAAEAPKMVKALADFFRYTISKKDTIVTVQEELKNIEDYLTIQNYRFQNKFVYNREFDTSAPYMNCRVIKMMLQPVVENAIFHGLEPMIGKGAITIRIYLTTKHLRIVIKDNGMGISPENLHKLNEEILKNDHVESIERSKYGIALKNVNQRIRLYFGREYGISIYSKEKIGTEVIISLPIVDDMDVLPNTAFNREGAHRGLSDDR